MKPRRHWWIWIIVGFYIWFIFHNSMQVAEASNQASIKVTWWIINQLQKFGIYFDFNVFHHYVRKAAHFLEFGGLGFLVTLALALCPIFPHWSLNFLLFLFAIPFADETLQKYVSGRSSQISDMIIDASGFILGGFACYLFVLVVRDIGRRLLPHPETERN